MAHDTACPDLAQNRGYLPDQSQNHVPNQANSWLSLCRRKNFSLAHASYLSQSASHRLSDNLCPIGNNRAIENGRYASADPINQSLISITAGAAWSIAARPNPVQPSGVPSPARRQPVMEAQKKQRPLIRYAGSAAETSIGPKPIGSELSARAYPERPVCQARLALAQEQQRDPACLH